MEASTKSTCQDLARLFSPRSIAIVGASAEVTRISGQPMAFLLRHGFTGRLYPVNPKYEEISGVRCYPDVASLPDEVDLALILIPAEKVPAVLEDCGAKGIPFAVIYSAGFAEVGESGRGLQVQVAAIAARYGIGVIGPNCQGLMNVRENLYAGFGTAFAIEYRPGGVSVVSQSGGFGSAILMMADEEAVGFRAFVSTGNESTITALDLISYLCEDAETKIIVAYIEGLKDARRLVSVGRKALAAGKPFLVWKVGSSDAGAAAAMSHTANLAGAREIYQSVFEQIGAIQISDVDDVSDFSRALAAGRLPKGNRVAVVTVSGGAGILLADHCSMVGVQLPALSDSSVGQLRDILPTFAVISNPIDVTAGIMNKPEVMSRCLSIIANDPNVDSVVVACAAQSGRYASILADAIRNVHAETDKPVLVAWNSRLELAGDAYAIVDAAGIPRFRTPVRCARALGVLCKFADSVRKYSPQETEPRPAVRKRGHSWIEGRSGVLSEYEGARLIAEHGIPIVRGALVPTGEAVPVAASALRFPLVAKIQSPDIPHKSEANGVRIGIQSTSELLQAVKEVTESARKHSPQARLEGVLIQEQIQGAVEVLLGLKNDPAFGPTVVYGIGGIFVEIYADFSTRVVPVSREEALSMIRETKGFALLSGARGRQPADIEALVDTILRLSDLAVDLGDRVAELDINPLFVLPNGRGVLAGDALVKLRG